MSESLFYLINHRDKGLLGYTTCKILAMFYIRHAKGKEDLSFNNGDFPPGTKNLDDEAKSLARESLRRKLAAEDEAFLSRYGLTN